MNGGDFLKSNFYVEFYGKQVSEASLIDEAKKTWTDSGKKASDLKSLTLYVKPEDNQVYCVFNEEDTGCFPLD